MSELRMLIGPIIRGQYNQMKEALDTKLPKDVKLYLEDEPYCNLQGRAVIRTFKLLMDDPRFVFDDLFIARQLYFSAAQSREAVMNHPKFKKVVQARNSFMEYFYIRYGANANITEVGMLQRYIQAERSIAQWKEENKKKNQFRVLFILYPALVKFSRRFIEDYYSPEGKGYYKSKASFEALAKA
jgi:hypothetical protein